MVAVTTPKPPDRVVFSVTMERPLRDRIDAVVAAIRAAQAGVKTDRVTVIEDILAGGTTLEELERRWLTDER